MSGSKEYNRCVRSVREGLESDREALQSGTCSIGRRGASGDWQDITADEIGRLTFQIDGLSDILAGG
jgi:hypothetical protein